MIPLSPTKGVKNFPKLSLVFVLTILGVELFLRFLPSSRLELLHNLSFKAGVMTTLANYSLISPFLHPHIFSLIINILFLWAFLPSTIETRGAFRTFFLSYIAVVGALFTYAHFIAHPTTSLLSPETFVAAVLGVTMRDQIWSSTTTLVPGHWGLRVFEVPSYVLLFFYMFYIFLGQLFLEEALANAPMAYFPPILAFLISFSLASLRIFRKSPQIIQNDPET